MSSPSSTSLSSSASRPERAESNGAWPADMFPFTAVFAGSTKRRPSFTVFFWLPEAPSGFCCLAGAGPFGLLSFGLRPPVRVPWGLLVPEGGLREGLLAAVGEDLGEAPLLAVGEDLGVLCPSFVRGGELLPRFRRRGLRRTPMVPLKPTHASTGAKMIWGHHFLIAWLALFF